MLPDGGPCVAEDAAADHSSEVIIYLRLGDTFLRHRNVILSVIIFLPPYISLQEDSQEQFFDAVSEVHCTSVDVTIEAPTVTFEMAIPSTLDNDGDDTSHLVLCAREVLAVHCQVGGAAWKCRFHPWALMEPIFRP
jgi:hypothetical protein